MKSPTLFLPAESGAQRVSDHWFKSWQYDPYAIRLYRRHYTFNPKAKLHASHSIVGPGERMVLISATGDTLWVWRKEKYRLDGQTGVNCALFRNEGRMLSSLLIREASEVAWGRWPGDRLFTFINPLRIRSTNPGYCYLMAGWNKCGMTPKGLLVFEVLPV